MKKYLSIGLVTLSVFLLTGCGKQETTGDGASTSSSGGGENQITAKEAYKIALSEAKKYSSDCQLINVNTSRAQNNGKSRSWFILFSCPAKNKGYKVNIINGKVDQVNDSYKLDEKTISDNWINSDEVAKIAIPKCGTTTESDYYFQVDKSSMSKPAEWHVDCAVGENKTLIVKLDAATGNYLETSKAGIGW